MKLLPLTDRQQRQQKGGAKVGTARVSIHRSSGGAAGPMITISIEDALSGTCFCEVELTPEEFGNAVTGSSSRPGSFILHAGSVGKVHEHKSEVIPFSACVQEAGWDREQRKQAAVAPFEVDGWKADLGDLGNGHKSAGRDAYRVTFHRYVDPPVDPVE